MSLFVLAVALFLGDDGAPNETPVSARLGVDTALTVSYGERRFFLLGGGGRVEDGKRAQFMLARLEGRYEFGRLGLPGLVVGLELPFVRNSNEGNVISTTDQPGSPRGSTGGTITGIGDISLVSGYLTDLADAVELGAKVRVKAATGQGPYERAPGSPAAGNGHNHIQASILAIAKIPRVVATVESGYVVTLARDVEAPIVVERPPPSAPFQAWLGAAESTDGGGVRIDPPNVFFSDVALGYRGTAVEWAVHALYAETFDDSGFSYTAVSVDAAITITDLLRVKIAWGMPLDGLGYNLSYGYPLAGRNWWGGPLMLTAGLTAEF